MATARSQVSRGSAVRPLYWRAISPWDEILALAAGKSAQGLHDEAGSPRKPFGVGTVVKVWCGRVDSNHHGIATASPSSWCVCQFRHDRKGLMRYEDYLRPICDQL